MLHSFNNSSPSVTIVVFARLLYQGMELVRMCLAHQVSKELCEFCFEGMTRLLSPFFLTNKK